MYINNCYLGQPVEFNHNDDFLGIEKGKKGKIERISRKDNYITVWGQQFDPSNFDEINHE